MLPCHASCCNPVRMTPFERGELVGRALFHLLGAALMIYTLARWKVLSTSRRVVFGAASAILGLGNVALAVRILSG
jgi:hypothetical protein